MGKTVSFFSNTKVAAIMIMLGLLKAFKQVIYEKSTSNVKNDALA